MTAPGDAATAAGCSTVTAARPRRPISARINRDDTLALLPPREEPAQVSALRALQPRPPITAARAPTGRARDRSRLQRQQLARPRPARRVRRRVWYRHAPRKWWRRHVTTRRLPRRGYSMPLGCASAVLVARAVGTTVGWWRTVPSERFRSAVRLLASANDSTTARWRRSRGYSPNSPTTIAFGRSPTTTISTQRRSPSPRTPTTRAR
jgi:hypothetical protein